MSANLQTNVERFLQYKRALGRKYRSEEHAFRMLIRFAHERGTDRLDQLTGGLIEEFLTSRPRPRPRSFNHLVGVVAGLLDWAVANELLAVSPLQTHRRPVVSTRIPFLFDAVQARQLLAAAALLPDNPRAQQRGQIYHAIFALCYGLGLRAGEACGLRLRDVDTNRRLLVVIGGKFGKSRLVPHGPRVAQLVGAQLMRRRADGPSTGLNAPLFTFDGFNRVRPETASHTFHQLIKTLNLQVPDGVFTADPA
jgi:integrase